MKQQVVTSPFDLDRLEDTVVAATRTTVSRLQQLFARKDALDVFAELKFVEAGCDPLDESRALNVVEQLNQTFTYLASIAAARWLFKHHPDHAPFILNLGTMKGIDVESSDGHIAAETFAATHPGSNRKLLKDVERVSKAAAAHKYVFFLSPVEARGVSPADVTVVRLEHPTLSTLGQTFDR